MAPAAARRALAGGALIAGAAAGVPRLRRAWSRWGATEDECSRALPGDDLVPVPKLASTRAVTIDAPPEQVWPWLVQIGQGRGGLYSYDALENLIGCDIHSADRILPEHQHLAPGDVIRAGRRDTYPCWVVTAVDPPHALVLQGAGTPGDLQVPEPVDEVPDHGYVASTWQWVLEPLDGGARTRLLVRQRCTYSPGQAVLWHVVDAVGFVMERRMLIGIKARAEASAHTGPRGATITAATVVAAVILLRGRRRFGADSARFGVLAVWVPMTWLGTISRVAQPRLPDGYHRLRRWERDGRAYERVGVRTAKRLLRRGPLAVCNPRLHLPAERTPERLAELDRAMRDAEASHAILLVATLVLVGHAVRRRRWRAAGAMVLSDVVMNGYPVMLQRYNRARLAHRSGTDPGTR